MDLMVRVLTAVEELILEFDRVTKSNECRGTGGRDCDGSLFYENEIEELRLLAEKIEGRSWEELVETIKSTPYHLVRENARLDADHTARREYEITEAIMYREDQARRLKQNSTPKSKCHRCGKPLRRWYYDEYAGPGLKYLCLDCLYVEYRQITAPPS
jgi:hypothetical protein